MAISEVFQQTEEKMKKSIDAVRKEFSEVSTGRANPALVEDMRIDYYGTPTPLKQIAAVSAPDAQTIMIQPWDKSAIVDIERGIQQSNINITPNNDGNVIRLIVPALSEERRKEMIKIVKDMAEKGRVSLRSARRDANDKIKKLQSDSAISEDDSFKAQDRIQKLTDKYIADIDTLFEKKSKDLLEI